METWRATAPVRRSEAQLSLERVALAEGPAAALVLKSPRREAACIASLRARLRRDLVSARLVAPFVVYTCER
jgi:hypothetical protein